MTVRFQHIGSTALAAALLCLLTALAVLQYRWLGQLGAAELERLRAASRAGTTEIARDFDREITRAFLWLRLDPVMAERPDGNAFAAVYDRWTREAPHPRIVRDVFLLEAGEAGAPRTLRFDPDRRSFVP